MQERLSITDESVYLKWMKLEIGGINEGLVVDRKTLVTLSKENIPTSITKGGKEYFFAKDIITMLQKSLPKELQNILKLPILFFFDADVKDSLYTNDEPAVITLQYLGELSQMRTIHAGKLWVGKPIVYSLMKKYPTVIQIVMG